MESNNALCAECGKTKESVNHIDSPDADWNNPLHSFAPQPLSGAAQPAPQPAIHFLARVPGGHCFAHGDYKDTLSCPHWPDCLKAKCAYCGDILALHKCHGPKTPAAPVAVPAPKVVPTGELDMGDYEMNSDEIREALLTAAPLPPPQEPTKLIAQLAEALNAMLTMMDRGEKPQKLDEALTWRENDELARKLATDALAATRPAALAGETRTGKQYLNPQQRAKWERRLEAGMDASEDFPECTPDQRAVLWTLLELKQSERLLARAEAALAQAQQEIRELRALPSQPTTPQP